MEEKVKWLVFSNNETLKNRSYARQTKYLSCIFKREKFATKLQ